MTTSFLVAADPRGTAPLRLAARLTPTGRWSNPVGTVEVLTWAERGWPADNLWADAHGAVAWGGWPVPVGGDGRPTTTAATLRSAAARSTIDRWDELRGSWSTVALGPDGAGRAFGDALGLRGLYLGRSGEAVIAGSDPHRVAAASTTGRPGRDPVTAAALASVTVRPPRRTGYVGIELLDAGASVLVAADGTTTIDDPGPPWLELGPLAGASPAELIDVVRAELGAGLTTALGLGDPTVELTGGKDSRLVLAIAMELGIARRLTFETAGPPTLPDVLIAEEIANDHGLHHRRVFRRAATDPLPYAELFARFVDATAGMVSGWHARPLVARTDELRITGLNGEALRTRRRIEPSWTDDQVASLVALMTPGSSLGLARPDLDRELAAGFGAGLVRIGDLTTDPHDLLDSLHLAVLGRQQYGPLDALQPANRLLVLSSLRAIRAAVALGGRARHAELIHFSITDAASRRLARTPFAGDRWPADLASFVEDDLPELAPVGRVPAPPGSGSSGGRPTSPPRPVVQNLMAFLHRDLGPERRATLAEHLSDPANPVWDLLDRTAAQQALDRYEQLAPKQRKELFGAATAACWMAG